MGRLRPPIEVIVTHVAKDGAAAGYVVNGPPQPTSRVQSPAHFVAFKGRVIDEALTFSDGSVEYTAPLRRAARSNYGEIRRRQTRLGAARSNLDVGRDQTLGRHNALTAWHANFDPNSARAARSNAQATNLGEAGGSVATEFR